MHGHAEVASIIIGASADPDKTDVERRTPAMWAARHGHVSVVQLLLKRGCRIERRDLAGLTIMDHAREFLEVRAAVRAMIEANQRLLVATAAGDILAAQHALSEGAYVDAVDEEGRTALALAEEGNSVDMVRLLMQRGASPALVTASSATDEITKVIADAVEATTQLLQSARAGRWEQVKEALRLGACVYAQEEGTLRSALMHAASWGDSASDAMKHLIEAAAPLEAREQLGWTSLHFAVKVGSIECVSTLIFHKANVNAESYLGNTGLHISALSGDGVMVQMLFKAGCALEHANRKGQTALQEAVRVGSAEATTTLLVYGAKIIAQNELSQQVFSHAVYCGSVAVVQAMLSDPVPPPKICSKEWLAFYMGKVSKRPGEESDDEEEEEEAAELPDEAAYWYDEEDDGPKFEEHQLIFQPGDAGFTVDEESGLVNYVDDGGQADRLGVKIDWRIVTLRPVDITTPEVEGGPEADNGGEDENVDGEGKEQQEESNANAGDEEEEEEEEEYSEWVLYKNSTGSLPYCIKFEEPIQPEEPETAAEDQEADVDEDGVSEASEKSSSISAISSATDPDSDGPKNKELAPRFGCWTLIYESSRMRDQLLLKDLVQPVEAFRVITETDKLGRTPLILAATNQLDPRKGLCGCELAKPILRANAKVDIKDTSGSTALMYAAARGDFAMVTVLLEGDADANERNYERKSAFDMAMNKQMRELLVRKMVERRIQPSKASEALVEALEAAAEMKLEEEEARSQNYIVRIEGLPRVGDEEAVEQVLRELLRKKGAGRPQRVEVVNDPITQVPTGLAYVDYHHVKLAEAVMAADGEKVKQSVVRVFREA